MWTISFSSSGQFHSIKFVFKLMWHISIIIILIKTKIFLNEKQCPNTLCTLKYDDISVDAFYIITNNVEFQSNFNKINWFRVKYEDITRCIGCIYHSLAHDKYCKTENLTYYVWQYALYKILLYISYNWFLTVRVNMFFFFF